MNRWARLAREHWALWLPTRYRALLARGNPEGFFTELGVQVATEIEALYDAMLSDMPPGLNATEAAGWQRTARQNAESQILSEMVLLAPEVEQTEQADPTGPTMVVADQWEEIYRQEEEDLSDEDR
jgi:hypothetical protein